MKKLAVYGIKRNANLSMQSSWYNDRRPVTHEFMKRSRKSKRAKVTCSLSPKPPLGLRPRWLAEEQRLIEVACATDRYLESGKPIPLAWVDEMVSLIGRMEHWRAWKQLDAMMPNGQAEP